jgi:ABC-type nitrate/sulfonate/bicarbonate transport system substrate-binding protein
MLLGWFANENWLAAHGDIAAKFVSAIRAGSAWANTHHSESAEMLTKHSRVTLDVARKIVRPEYGLDLNPAMLVPVLDLAVRYGILDRSLPVSELLWHPKA